MASNHSAIGKSNGSIDAVQETAHASQPVTIDASAFPALQAVSTPSFEQPNAFAVQQPLLTGNSDIGDANNLSAPSNSSPLPTPSISRSNSFSSRSPVKSKVQRISSQGTLCSPVCFPYIKEIDFARENVASTSTGNPRATTSQMVLELADGTAFQGFSFGVQDKSISGECVFQTGEYDSISISQNVPYSTILLAMSVSLAPVSSWLCHQAEQL